MRYRLWADRVGGDESVAQACNEDIFAGYREQLSYAQGKKLRIPFEMLGSKALVGFYRDVFSTRLFCKLFADGIKYLNLCGIDAFFVVLLHRNTVNGAFLRVVSTAMDFICKISA